MILPLRRALPGAAAILCLAAAAAVAQPEIRTERVQLARGASSAVVEASIAGPDDEARVDLMRSAARRNDVASDRLEMIITASADGDDAAQADPSLLDDAFLSVTGVSDALNLRAEPSINADVVTKLLAGVVLRNLGCRDAEGRTWCEVEQLDGGTGGWAAAAYLGEAGAALRAGQGAFDATGQIPCAQVAGQPTTPCDFGVAREGGGSATVVVTLPDGRERAIFFVDGAASSADTSEADGYGELEAEREGDLNLIRVGDERFEIPDAVIFGG